MSLSLRDLHFTWPDGRALFAGLDLDLEPGGRLAVIGANGSGKTTLGRMIVGMLPPAAPQSLTWQGRPMAELSRAERASQTQIVGQRPDLQLSGRAATVRAEVAFGPENLNLDPSEIALRCDQALEVMGLRHLAARDPRRLSGGESQRLAIAAALACKPRLLILDEPLTDLDRTSRQGLSTRLADLAPGLTILALDIRPDDWQAQGFTRFLTLAEGRLHPLEALAPSEPIRAYIAIPQNATPLVSIRELSFAHPGAAPLLSGINLDLPAGAAIAVTGPNGAGKSTLMRLIAGLHRPDQGEISLAGLNPAKVKARALAGVLGMVFQNADRQFSAARLVDEASLAPKLQGARDPAARAQEALEAVGLGQQAQTHPFDLNNGARRLAAVAAACAHGPKLLILDETQRGLDASHLARLEARIRAFCAAGGSVLFVCHDDDFTARNASHRLAVADGRADLSVMG